MQDGGPLSVQVHVQVRFCTMAVNLMGLRAGARPCLAAKASSAKASSQPPMVMLKDARTESFVQWCLSSLDVSCDKLRPAVFSGIRGMAASQPIALEDMLITVPRSSAIVLAPKMKCPCPDFVSPDYWNTQPWFVKLGIMLLYEKSLGSKSRLAQYVELLPAKFESPVLWSAAQLELLQYPPLKSKVAKQRQEWESYYKAFSAALKPGQTAISQKEFFWALCAVRSRTFSGPHVGSSLQDRARLAGFVGVLATANIALGLADAQRTLSAAIAVFIFNVLYEVILSRNLKQYAMAPLMDFINHSASTKSEVSLDYFTDRYSVTAGRAFAPGEQVYISYGTEQTNDSLMQYYGFVEADNPADVYVMVSMLDRLSQQGVLAPDRLRQLEAAGAKSTLEQVKVARTGLPGPTLNTLRYLITDDKAAAAGPNAFTGPGNEAAEQKLAQLLVALVTEELKCMGTSMSDDAALLAAGGKNSLGVEERLAVEFRLEKKRILAACLKSLGAA